MTQDVAVLDFGSSKITVIIGDRGVNNTINIKGMGESEYAGFCDGEWLELDQLSMAIAHAISKAETNSRTKIRHMYVGVPGEFSTSICKEVAISLLKKRKISDADVEMLHEQGNEFESDPDYMLVNSQPIYYTIDDGRKLIQPEGVVSSKLGGLISYTLAEKKFVNLINDIMDELQIDTSDYVSSLLAEVLFLFDDMQRDQFVILLDVGHITTSVTLARGDGILSQYNFSIGGGHITGDLAMSLGIGFTKAESLKRKVNLSLDASETDVYEVQPSRDLTESYSAEAVNEIVCGRIEIIAKMIAKCLDICEYDFPKHAPYYLTGGGLSYLRGGKDYLSKMLGKPIEIVFSKLPQLDRPHLSSCLGLMDMILNQHMPAQKKGWLSKIFGK